MTDQYRRYRIADALLQTIESVEPSEHFHYLRETIKRIPYAELLEIADEFGAHLDRMTELADEEEPNPDAPDDAVLEQLVACRAMTLYQYNVAHLDRLEALADVAVFDAMRASAALTSAQWASTLDAPAAKAYLRLALDKYEDEARRSIKFELGQLWSEGA